MYSRFQLAYKKFDQGYYDSGLKLFNQQKSKTHALLDQYLSKNGVIKGSELQADWFPQVDADIFLSHSHADQKFAISLAGMLSKLNLNVFIDSTIWGYADELLQEIDDEYCVNDDGRTYNYKKRNKSTSHVHMMLATAINMMIDKTECLMFLNTPNSISSDGIGSETNSPWLYAELATSKLVRREELGRYRKEISKSVRSQTKLYSESFEIHYRVDLNHLIPLSEVDLLKWQLDYLTEFPSPSNALDVLYEQIEEKMLNS
ncbi:hypothetical protein ACFJIV_02380 [Mucilaginibacter sp. UC70_90]